MVFEVISDKRLSPMNLSHRRSQLLNHLHLSHTHEIELSERFNSIVLEGQVQTWDQKVRAGWKAASWGYHGVVNHLQVPEIPEETIPEPAITDATLEGREYDVCIVGGGVIGAAIARELSQWDLKIILVEKESDLAVHTSGRNDGMIHDGFAAPPGTRKAHYNVRGNRLWEPLCRDLDIAFHRPGSLVLFPARFYRLLYPAMAARARKNGVDGWEYWSPRKVRALEPQVAGEQRGALFLPSAGVLSPYKATLALAEHAVENGVLVSLNTQVQSLEREGNRLTHIQTNRGTFRTRVLVNAAGNWADTLAAMAGDEYFSLHQRRGTDLVLDRDTGKSQNHILSMPDLLQSNRMTKGGGLVVTTEGNMIVGPTAFEAPGREDYSTRPEEVTLLAKHLRLNKALDLSQVITYFSGVRPCTYDEDFLIEPSPQVANLVHVAGIQSPGLASAPAIAQDVGIMVVDILNRVMEVKPRASWHPRRKSPLDVRALPIEARHTLIQDHPSYGAIVCRCEEVSEGEIRDCLHTAVPATTLDGVKRRTRAGSGRCHGGFCTPRVMDIMSSETQTPLESLTKKGGNSWICRSRS